MKNYIYPLAALLLVGCSSGNVETWSPEQRAEQRDLVVVAKITNIKQSTRVKGLNPRGTETWGCLMIVEEKLKGESGHKEGTKFPVLFERGKPLEGGGRETRTPPFPALKNGDSGTFYLTSYAGEDKVAIGYSAESPQRFFLLESSFDFIPKTAGSAP
ncbi:MAG: hypothetical protein AAF492_07695 [Verrucomicrobiota bacterium]